MTNICKNDPGALRYTKYGMFIVENLLHVENI